MRLDTFLAGEGLTATPVDLFDDHIVEVGASAGWVVFDSTVGLHVWVCRTEPLIGAFCANAVLTLHDINAVIDHSMTFGMLAEQQLAMTPNCLERRRHLGSATEGAGSLGILELIVDHESGPITSVSRARIVSTDRKTCIAQLTITASHHSPVDMSTVWMTVTEGSAR